MKKIAIIGSGPTEFTPFTRYENKTPLAVSVFEKADEAGVGMPYNDDENSRLMLANIVSIEIPPFYDLPRLVKEQSESHLARLKR